MGQRRSCGRRRYGASRRTRRTVLDRLDSPPVRPSSSVSARDHEPGRFRPTGLMAHVSSRSTGNGPRPFGQLVHNSAFTADDVVRPLDGHVRRDAVCDASKTALSTPSHDPEQSSPACLWCALEPGCDVPTSSTNPTTVPDRRHSSSATACAFDVEPDADLPYQGDVRCPEHLHPRSCGHRA